MRAKSFYHRHVESQLFKVSEEFIQSIIDGRLPFARESSNYLVASGVGGNDSGLYGWGCTDLKAHFDLMPVKLQDEIIPEHAKWKVSIVLVKETLDLLKEFEVSRWAAEVTEKQYASFNMYKALNLIWCQIIVLDIAIQFFIKGQWLFQPIENGDSGGVEEMMRRIRQGKPISDLLERIDPFRTEHWGKQEAAVVQSIAKAWRPPNTTADYIQRKSKTLPGQFQGEAEDGNDDDQGGAEGDDEAAPPSADGDKTSDDEDLERDPEDAAATTSNTPSNGTMPNEKDQPQSLAFQDWQLAKHLEKNDKVFPGARTKGTIRKCKFLADMLELRAIFVVALLCLHPDSSDIYLTENEDIEMPMA